MINGLYSGASALDVFGRQQELIASNLAHLNTPGHKRMLFSFLENSESVNEESTSRPGTSVEGFSTDFSQGNLKPTGRPLDVAISGDGFFEFERVNENVFSRGGPLFRDPTGKLVNAEGLAILSEGESISIPLEVSDRDIVIDISGTISANGEELGKISVINFDDNQLLESDTQTFFRQGEAEIVEEGEFQILQGSRELSNAHPVTELITLIVGSRRHESANRVMSTITDALKQSVRE